VNVEDAGDFFSEEHSRVAATDIDLLVTNELPFGRWIAADAGFDRQVAQASIDIHRAGVESFRKLDIPAVLSSWPVWGDKRLASEGFELVRTVSIAGGRHSGCAGFNQVGVVSPCNVRMGAQAALQVILSDVAKERVIRITLRAARLRSEIRRQR